MVDPSWGSSHEAVSVRVPESNAAARGLPVELVQLIARGVTR